MFGKCVSSDYRSIISYAEDANVLDNDMDNDDGNENVDLER